MICPKCLKDNVSPIGDSHYVCNDPNCTNENGSRTQFRHVPDEKIKFPYNQIFITRKKSEFYREPYLKLEEVGDPTTTR